MSRFITPIEKLENVSEFEIRHFYILPCAMPWRGQNNWGSGCSTVVAATDGCQMQPVDIGNFDVGCSRLFVTIQPFQRGIPLRERLFLRPQACLLVVFWLRLLNA